MCSQVGLSLCFDAQHYSPVVHTLYLVPIIRLKRTTRRQQDTGIAVVSLSVPCELKSTLLEATNLDFQKISIRTMLTKPILGVSLNSPVQDSRRCCCCVKPCACAPPKQEAAAYYKYIRVPGTTLSAIPAPAIVLPFGYF